MKPNFAKLALIAATMILSAACAKQEDKGATPASGAKANATSNYFDGAWVKPCKISGATSSQQTVVIRDSVLTSESFQFSDQECRVRVMSLKATAFLIPGTEVEQPIAGMQVISYLEKIQVTAFTDGAVSSLNQTNYCGINTWTKDASVEVTGKDCGAGPLPKQGEISVGFARKKNGSYSLDSSSLQSN